MFASRTRSSAIAKRPRDASCLYSFNTKRRAQSFIISCFGLRTIKFFSVLFGVFVHAAGRHKQTFAGASPTVRSTLHGRR